MFSILEVLGGIFHIFFSIQQKNPAAKQLRPKFQNWKVQSSTCIPYLTNYVVIIITSPCSQSFSNNGK